jgi:hypothetical protein
VTKGDMHINLRHIEEIVTSLREMLDAEKVILSPEGEKQVFKGLLDISDVVIWMLRDVSKGKEG